MVQLIEPRHNISLDDYESVAPLSVAVRDLRQEARGLLPALDGRRVWMVNSTSRGGGVAELMPALVTLMSELGVETHWLVMETDDPQFFRFTKRLHNLVQGDGDPVIDDDDRRCYEEVSRATANAIGAYLEPGDILVVHDPQPMAAGAFLRQSTDVVAIWRCHIGLDEQTPETKAAWDFLCAYADAYDHAVFTAPEYIPGCLAGKSTIIHPGIDPLSHKNRDLPVHKIVGILADGSLIRPSHPVPSPPFSEPARRFQQDGSWAPATEPEDFGLLYRPVVTQVSRWDRFKGYRPLLDGFIELKRNLHDGADAGGSDELSRRTLELARLVLAGPDPASIQDDPEAADVLEEICEAYQDLSPELQEDVAIISLPMASGKENALIVNALHRCSDVVVQNSLREGFGLTATEAMWKSIAVVATRAAGLRQQIRPGLNGYAIDDPHDRKEIARLIGDLLRHPKTREMLGGNAQRTVHDEFLVFPQVRRWLELLVDAVERSG